MRSLTGHLLISSAGLFDPNFRHTVVVIGTHNEEGALGVILNRPTAIPIEDAVPPLVELTGPDAPLFEGGPVQPEQPVLVVEAGDRVALDVPILDGVGILAGEVDAGLRPDIRRARVFAGYSGWGPGQLEDELAADSWIVEPARPEDVFTDDPTGLWKRVLLRKGGEYRRIAMIPKDLRVN